MYRLSYILMFCIVFSCTSKSIDLLNFDESAWQTDKDGCNGVRAEMRDNLIKVKSDLKGLNGDQVTAVLGKPNKTNLASRNQKYFIYNIACPKESEETSTLSIRFNATGLVYEVVVF